jgi:hypothetical protein
VAPAKNPKANNPFQIRVLQADAANPTAPDQLANFLLLGLQASRDRMTRPTREGSESNPHIREGFCTAQLPAPSGTARAHTMQRRIAPGLVRDDRDRPALEAAALPASVTHRIHAGSVPFDRAMGRPPASSQSCSNRFGRPTQGFHRQKNRWPA